MEEGLGGGCGARKKLELMTKEEWKVVQLPSFREYEHGRQTWSAFHKWMNASWTRLKRINPGPAGT